MYAIVRHYRTDASSIEPMVRHVDREFADPVPKQVGSVLYTAVRTGDGTAMTITMFPDAEAAARSEPTVAALQQTLMNRFGVEEYAVQRGEVLISQATPEVATPVRFAADDAGVSGATDG